MKRKYIMMTLLISGSKQPGNDIDVYLAPLIDDLKNYGVPERRYLMHIARRLSLYGP